MLRTLRLNTASWTTTSTPPTKPSNVWAKCSSCLRGLAIAIACLGLFGLATFSAEQRAKEISIRKAMGAQVNQLVVLMTKDFTRLVIIAFVLSIPVTWYALEKWWLESFAYRTSYSAVVVVVAGGSALLIAWLTISFQSIRAALINPAVNLKSE